MNKIKGILFAIFTVMLGGTITAALLVPESYYENLINSPSTNTSQITHSVEGARAVKSIAKKSTLSSSIEVVDGTDWRLPKYAKSSDFGGLVAEPYSSPDYVSTLFHIVRWDETNPAPGRYDFSKLKKLLNQFPDQTAMLRLEVHSKCEAPNWVLDRLRHTKLGSLIFWDSEYLATLSPYIKEVAAFVKSHPQIISVQLGISDGEYKGSCKLFNMKDGWGEFTMTPAELKEAKTEFGFTPEKFENSVKKIVTVYAEAFGKHSYKLAFNNFDPYFSWTDIAEPYNDRMESISKFVLNKGIGNRDGEVEHWMRYIHKVYGMQLHPTNNNSCSLLMDENVANRISGRYWGTENEFYGDLDYVRIKHGNYSNQPYRFFISSMRALQMRRTHSLIYGQAMKKMDHPVYKTQDFLHYLNKTMGKHQTDTPDLFIMLGERYVANYRMTAEYPEHQKCQINGGTAIRSFGRWLTENSDSKPAMLVKMPTNQNKWDQGFYLPNGVNYEFAARSSKEFAFNINENLAKLRCSKQCNTTIKITYLDENKSEVWIETPNGRSKTLTTKGDGKLRTASFKTNLNINNDLGGNDFWVRSAKAPLSLMLLRVNLPAP